MILFSTRSSMCCIRDESSISDAVSSDCPNLQSKPQYFAPAGRGFLRSFFRNFLMSCFIESTRRGTLIFGWSNLNVFFIGILLGWADIVRWKEIYGAQCSWYQKILPSLVKSVPYSAR